MLILQAISGCLCEWTEPSPTLVQLVQTALGEAVMLYEPCGGGGKRGEVTSPAVSSYTLLPGRTTQGRRDKQL